MSPMSNATYDRDFYAWSQEQAQLLRSGKVAEADLDHIAEEIESMGKSEKRELVNRLSVLLMHLLKWQFQPTARGTSWQLTIEEQRERLSDHLADNPSLKATLDASIASGFRLAILGAARETGLDRTVFPLVCPWSFDQIMADGFLPD